MAGNSGDTMYVEDPEKGNEIKEDITAADSEKSGDPNILKLSKALAYEDKTYTELSLDFGRLTGESITKAERLFRIEVPEHNNIQNILASPTYWQILGAIAAGVRYGVVKAMPIKDSLELVGRVRLFFEG